MPTMNTGARRRVAKILRDASSSAVNENESAPPPPPPLSSLHCASMSPGWRFVIRRLGALGCMPLQQIRKAAIPAPEVV